MLVFDTNILIYASNNESEFQDACLKLLDDARRDPTPAFLTWNVCYEFMRVSTHHRVLSRPWRPRESWRFIEVLLESPGFSLLTASARHSAVLSQTMSELPDIRGNLMHDLHTAVLMREHGLSRIVTRDTDFHRFPFLDVVDPLR